MLRVAGRARKTKGKKTRQKRGKAREVARERPRERARRMARRSRLARRAKSVLLDAASVVFCRMAVLTVVDKRFGD